MKKKKSDIIYCLYRMKQSHGLVCAVKNCDWLGEITPLLNMNGVSLLVEQKTYSESRIEL